MEAFRAKVQAIQDQEAKVEKQFQSTSVAVDVHTFAALAEFPTNEQGTVDLQGIDEQRRRWGFELDVFFMIDTQCGGRAQVMWTHYLHIAFPFMMNWSLRDMLMALLLRVSFHRAAGRSWLQYVELFAGQGNLSKAAIRAGLSGVSLDKDYGEHQNILTGHGLVLALLALTATVPGALWWTGLPCSSFVILCVSVSQRCAENDFLGDESKDFVLEGNTIGDLSALLQFLAYMVQCNDGMEQPASSGLSRNSVLQGCSETYPGTQNSDLSLVLWWPYLETSAVVELQGLHEAHASRETMDSWWIGGIGYSR